MNQYPDESVEVFRSFAEAELAARDRPGTKTFEVLGDFETARTLARNASLGAAERDKRRKRRREQARARRKNR